MPDGGVGMPEHLKLLEFGQLVDDAFGTIPVHVGSSLTKKTGWRDVDVRLILIDADYEEMGFGNPEHAFSCRKWVAMCRAFSLLGREVTGLPIDFQIQQMTRANKQFGDCRRESLWDTRLTHQDVHKAR